MTNVKDILEGLDLEELEREAAVVEAALDSDLELRAEQEMAEAALRVLAEEPGDPIDSIDSLELVLDAVGAGLRLELTTPLRLALRLRDVPVGSLELVAERRLERAKALRAAEEDPNPYADVYERAEVSKAFSRERDLGLGLRRALIGAGLTTADAPVVTAFLEVVEPPLRRQ